MNVPNAVKMFQWHTCYNLLSTRGIVMSRACPICKLESKSLVHILWNCPSTTNVWGASSKIFQKCNFSGFDFLQVVEEMFRRCGMAEFELFVGISKRI